LSRPRELTILWQDDDLLVVDKPPRMLVVPAPGRRGNTVVDLVSRQLGQRVFAVHRLDEDTTGVLVLARTPASRVGLEEVFRTHRAQRVYLALASRVPSPPAGRIESRLIEGPDGVMQVTDDRRGEVAITEYRTLGRRDGGALLECRLETGRRNQIRAHLAAVGCPIVGDRKYGWRSGRRARVQAMRPLLHAWRLSLPHPNGESVVEVESTPPEVELRP
jgi:23S rRNA pseudouridine1911/1915/1917 synthase